MSFDIKQGEDDKVEAIQVRGIEGYFIVSK